MFESLRNKKLIEERLVYEKDYFDIDDVFIKDIEKSNELDLQISQYVDFYECNYEPDFVFSDVLEEYYYEEPDFIYYEPLDEYCPEHEFMELTYGCNGLLDYIPNNDLFDSLGDCDYPEGPNENLSGYNPFDEEFFNFDLIDYDIDQELDFDFEVVNESYEDAFEEYMGDCISEELNLKILIEEHLNEEKDFINSICDYSRQEELFLEELKTLI